MLTGPQKTGKARGETRPTRYSTCVGQLTLNNRVYFFTDARRYHEMMSIAILPLVDHTDEKSPAFGSRRLIYLCMQRSSSSDTNWDIAKCSPSNSPLRNVYPCRDDTIDFLRQHCPYPTPPSNIICQVCFGRPATTYIFAEITVKWDITQAISLGIVKKEDAGAD